MPRVSPRKAPRRGTIAALLAEQHALLDRCVQELQRSLLGIRVLPMRHVFRRFPRLVREMAGDLGKSIRLVTEGDATEADKAVVEALSEPLLHVLRNAVDHGVEPAARRAASGKTPVATIWLRAARDGEQIVVDVEDDGAGIDTEKVRRAAEARGIAAADAIAAMTDDEVTDLIFVPGLSTAASVSEVSGRGVGMDAVRSAVARLGGRVEVETRPGAGTRVLFRVPFTVMMSRVLTLEAGAQVFGVPMEIVVETVRLPRERIMRVGAAEAFVLRDRTIPLINLTDAIGLPREPLDLSCANLVIIAAGRPVGGARGGSLRRSSRNDAEAEGRALGRIARHRRNDAARRWPRADRARHAGIAAMTVRLRADGAIVLEGVCPAEDAEPLQRLLLEHPGADLDWRDCDQAHTAVLQVLLVARPRISGPPRAAFLQHFIGPILTRSQSLTATDAALFLRWRRGVSSAARGGAGAAAGRKAGMSYRVLIVDDSKLARMAIAKILGALRPDWTRIEATNPDEAVARFGETGADIALLDFNMPGRDGLASGVRTARPEARDAAGADLGQHPAGDRRAGARDRSGFPAEAADRGMLGRVSVERRTTVARLRLMAVAPAIELDEIERDALTELANIGVSRAAANLRDMVGPSGDCCRSRRSQWLRGITRRTLLGEREVGGLVAVHQAFAGDFSGRALLIFPESNSLELVRAVTGGDLPLEDIIDLEQEALAETGNIILNGCLATIANILQRTLKVSLPEIIRGSGPDFFDTVGRFRRRKSGSVPVHRFFRKRARYSRLHRNADGSVFAEVAATSSA